MNAYNKTRFNLIIGCLLAACLLSACSGVKTYPNTLTKNLFITNEGDFAGLLTDLVITVDIYKINSKCNIDYQGTINLNQKINKIGIPVGDYNYLDFKFLLDGIGSNRIVKYDTLLQPRFGYKYDIKVSYVDGSHDVVIREVKRNSSKHKRVMRIRIEDC